jgi:hypothetical protein
VILKLDATVPMMLRSVSDHINGTAGTYTKAAIQVPALPPLRRAAKALRRTERPLGPRLLVVGQASKTSGSAGPASDDAYVASSFGQGRLRPDTVDDEGVNYMWTPSLRMAKPV